MADDLIGHNPQDDVIAQITISLVKMGDMTATRVDHRGPDEIMLRGLLDKGAEIFRAMLNQASAPRVSPANGALKRQLGIN